MRPLRVRIVVWVVWLACHLTVGLALAEEIRPRTLLVSLDAVPYWVVADITDPELGEEAAFQGFKGPVPLVSTFPSSTSVALVGLLAPLGLEKSPGYEARFFDWQMGKARGGGVFSYAKIDFPWRDFFDWSRRNPAGSAIEAVRPVQSGIKRLRNAIREFADSEMDVSLIYIAATDTAVHVVGPDSIKKLLLELDGMLREARARRPDRPFYTVIFSDHGVAGGPPLINVSKATKKALTESGFHVAKKRLKRPDSVVMTPFGLVSNFEAYVADEHKPKVARVLSGVEGVDLCAYRVAERRWSVVGRSGSAKLSRRDSGNGLEWRYEVEGSDPLGYSEALSDLAAAGTPEQVEWLDDEAVFEVTKRHHFPDGFLRIADAFELVSNPASVICSLGEEYMYGAASTAALATVGKGKLRWTHGGLNAAATLGFLMSDADHWQVPEVARYNRALIPFRRDLARHANVIDPEMTAAGE